MASKTGRTSSRTAVLQSRLCSRKFTACMNYEAVCLPDDQEREQSEEFSSLLEGVQEFCDKAPSAVFLLGIMLVAIAVLSLCIWLAWSAYSADIAAFYKEAASAGGGFDVLKVPPVRAGHICRRTCPPAGQRPHPPVPAKVLLAMLIIGRIDKEDAEILVKQLCIAPLEKGTNVMDLVQPDRRKLAMCYVAVNLG
ncbi:hypothetical protein AK812_SmicGene2680 [Symbiodinium microadriaticum]|uniref:Uncharacterized protein n=1 Tax=Symbiodinium microadriaticum TaxID=2951 RepID=A0A1Q9F0M8_SYMMI|nr:hypothetical protein AK812_SmicGene2680 [Symbiodinium microadriaticum]